MSSNFLNSRHKTPNPNQYSDKSTSSKPKKRYRRDQCPECGESLDRYTQTCFMCDDIDDLEIY